MGYVMVHYLGDLEENMLEIDDGHGNKQVVPIVGMFKNDNGYYIVIKVEDNGKEEFVMYEVIKKEDGTECIQIITEKAKWDAAYESWMALNREALKLNEVHIL